MSPAFLLITSGRGPAECRLAVQAVVGALIASIQAEGGTASVVESRPEAPGWSSAVVEVQAPEAVVASWVGSVCFIQKFRGKGARQRWFVGVSLLPPAPTVPVWDPRDVEITAQRASGPGGQHVNTTSSAVRVRHIPTGTVAWSQDERSQHQNRARALERLHHKLTLSADQGMKALMQERWQRHDQLVRGAPVRTLKA